MIQLTDKDTKFLLPYQYTAWVPWMGVGKTWPQDKSGRGLFCKSRFSGTERPLFTFGVGCAYRYLHAAVADLGNFKRNSLARDS